MYTIRISEEQRAYIEAGVQVLIHGSRQIGNEVHEEADLLLSMLEDLPEQEAKSPDSLHDFTL